MNTISQIRAEVERLKGEEHLHYADWIVGYKTACDEILSFLDTLQEKSEKPINPVCEGLEEEIREFVEQEWDGLHDNDGNPLYTADYLEYVARHFYELGRQSKPKVSEDVEEAAKNYFDKTWGDGSWDIRDQVIEDFKAGAFWQKEQMMRTAVETWMLEGSMFEPEFIKKKVIVIKEEGK